MNKEQLFKWRTDRGLKQTELAKMAGISASYLSSLESGYSPFAKQVDRKLSRAMDLYDKGEDTTEPAPVHKTEEDSQWVQERVQALKELEEVQESQDRMKIPPPGKIWHVEQGQPKPVYEKQVNKSAPIDTSDREYLKNGHAPDTRYNTPKYQPDPALIYEAEELIRKNEIYRRVGSLLHSAQRKQVMYGMEKYPEPLNQDTWSELETIDHIIDESIDKLHYLMMLRIKLEQNNIHREE